MPWTPIGRKEGSSAEPTLDAAKAGLVSEWAQHTMKNPDKSTLILAYTNQDVFELNAKARDYLKATGQISAREYPIQTEGDRDNLRKARGSSSSGTNGRWASRTARSAPFLR